jgi:hypothetical protein
MSEKSDRLVEQRERLIKLAATQRTVLAQSIEPWRIPLARVDRGLATVRAMRRNPAWILGGVALLVVLRPYRVVTWLRRGWVAWQMLRGLRP